MTLLEPDVALTDFALALECAAFAWWLRPQRRRRNRRRFWFTAFFAALAAAALLGGSVHGFIADKHSALHDAIWCGTLIAIGLAAFTSWGIGATMILSKRHAAKAARAAAAIFAIYVCVVLIGYRDFSIAIIHYFPATLFLFTVMFLAWRRSRDAALFAGVVGVALTLAAAAVQQAGIGWACFDHNALYHLMQALALGLIYLAARHIVAQERHN